MKQYTASTTIHADPATIFQILTDTASYPSWDPGMDHIEGTIALGQKVKFFTQMDPSRAFPVTVTAFEPGKRIVLTGGMPLGLFKSERTHSLSANRDGSTDFKTEEIFSGLLLPLFGRSIPDLTANFERFAAGLKERAEKQK
jgi:hypothetical protein